MTFFDFKIFFEITFEVVAIQTRLIIFFLIRNITLKAEQPRHYELSVPDDLIISIMLIKPKILTAWTAPACMLPYDRLNYAII